MYHYSGSLQDNRLFTTKLSVMVVESLMEKCVLIVLHQIVLFSSKHSFMVLGI
ncbi:hypothetical protein OCA20_24600 [Bacillus cereus]|nr:hypothetical protein [Bacillus cereus]